MGSRLLPALSSLKPIIPCCISSVTVLPSCSPSMAPYSLCTDWEPVSQRGTNLLGFLQIPAGDSLTSPQAAAVCRAEERDWGMGSQPGSVPECAARRAPRC